MSMSVMAAQTYQVSDDNVAQVRDFLVEHGTRCLLAEDGEGGQVELPKTVYQALVQVVEALAAGKPVTVTPQEPHLTTQQAADLLGVSRPTVVRLIDSGELRAERPGSRRRLLLSDVLDFRERRREEQYAMLAATAVALDPDADPQDVIDRLREARKAAAEQNG
ncbi:MAG: helix-turn-helix domain-containing protein [Micrococcales bacterium]|nr:helix-turn-helix domain-containing protein [Micrococcales bacterium]MCL2668984.1 helix-turn-helix domain-containing protein [Micrococcales bacterium]